MEIHRFPFDSSQVLTVSSMMYWAYRHQKGRGHSSVVRLLAFLDHLDAHRTFHAAGD
jgi:hypothetical protein